MYARKGDRTILDIASYVLLAAVVYMYIMMVRIMYNITYVYVCLAIYNWQKLGYQAYLCACGMLKTIYR